MKTLLRLSVVAAIGFATPACSQDNQESYADGAVTSELTFPDSAWRTVDPENLIFLAAGLNDFVQGLGTAVIPTKRLFNHHPAAFGILQQPCVGQSSATASIKRW